MQKSGFFTTRLIKWVHFENQYKGTDQTAFNIVLFKVVASCENMSSGVPTNLDKIRADCRGTVEEYALLWLEV